MEDRLERVKDTVIIFLSGLAILLLILLSTYFFALAIDRCCSNSMSMTQEEIDERRRASPLVKRAGLAGMLRGESTKTLKQFFGRLAYEYQKVKVEGEDETTKEQKKAAKKKKSIETIDAALKSEEGDVENALEVKKDETDSSEPKKSAEVKDEPNDNEEEEDTELQELVEMEHTDGTCPICLNEYENGDKVMTGTSCSHLFHYDCMMKWLEKGHDHCAYCRKDMLSSKEYVEAASEAIGDDRVERLIRINEELKRRVNEELARVNRTNGTIPYYLELATILLAQPSQEPESEGDAPNTAAGTVSSEEPTSLPNNAPSVAYESEEAGPVAVPSGSNLEVLQESTVDPDIEAPEDREGGSPVDAAENSSLVAAEIKVVADENEYKTKEPSKEDVASEKKGQIDIESGSSNEERLDGEKI